MIFYGLVDKSDFIENGPWFDEPDLEIWEQNNTICIVKRSYHGSLCGYVGIKVRGSRSLSYIRLSKKQLDVHGGVTFEDWHIDYLVDFEEIDPTVLEWIDSYYFFGFDCAHTKDLWFLKKDLYYSVRHKDDVYRDWDYVCDQCNKLSDQLQRLVTLG